MKKVRKAQTQLEGFRVHILQKLTGLLESTTRTQAFEQNMSACMVDELYKLAADSLSTPGADPSKSEGEFSQQCHSLSVKQQLLSKLSDDAWALNSGRIKSLIMDFQELIDQLDSILIDKSLLSRQSKVLEKIILSHDKVAQWKDFVQQVVLIEFHDLFPFKVFTIAFAEEKGVSLSIYYLDSYLPGFKQRIRQQLIQEMLTGLNLSGDILLDYDEFQVRNGNRSFDLDNLRMVTETVPTEKSSIGGVLGVGYVADFPLSVQEESIIRSLLSVMVVGSSRALSGTLSELKYYSEHDPMTGLYNRRYFNALMEHEIERSARHQHEFSVLMIDLDNFKTINDSYGHLCGDRVLRHISQSLCKNVRKSDVLARFGGDEFAVILPETSMEQAKIAAESLRYQVRDMVFFDDDEQQSFRASASIGLVSYPNNAKTINALLSGADIAVFQAKEKGKDYVASLECVEDSIASKRKAHDLSEQLHKALDEEGLLPYFQPIVNCADGSVFAYEALARLKTENGDILSAGQFIEAADKHGITREIDREILAQVTQKLAEQIAGQQEPPRIFINLSPQEIQHREILQYAQNLCDELAIPARYIVFEITEREAVGDMANMRKFLTKLREKGFAFALDDFGSGYNSFHYLRELHFEYVKIDGDFISNILNSTVDNALVKTLNDLCHQLEISTIAEYVESEAIMQRLREIGIDYGQGFHLGRPDADFQTPP